MNKEELIDRRDYILKKSNLEINGAAEILWSRYLKSPCSFKKRDFHRAAFSACWNGGYCESPLEREGFSLREIIMAVSAGARSKVMSWVKNKKEARPSK